MNLHERKRAQEEFRTTKQICVATEAAGKGINLQFCRLMINYDLPWNPTRLEQRPGGIHRIGQERDVHVFNFVAAESEEGQEIVEGKILARLLHKLEHHPPSSARSPGVPASAIRVESSRRNWVSNKSGSLVMTSASSELGSRERPGFGLITGRGVRRPSLSPFRGLSPSGASHPRLTPWAIICRHSVAWGKTRPRFQKISVLTASIRGYKHRNNGRSMKLSSRVILITGGGRAIGQRIALRAAQEGADVAVIGPDQAELDRTTGEMRKLGCRSFSAVADVSSEREVIASVERIRALLGRIDVLVNNAGIIGPTKPVTAIDRSEWEAVMAVNLTGAFLCAKAVAPFMIEQRAGKIINISSIAGKQAYPLRAPYAVSKWGLIGLTLTLAKELGPYNIQVNAVCPGPVEGERMRTIIKKRAAELSQSPEDVERTYLNAAALGRMVREDDVASVVVFLASADADNLTGQAIDVAAGYGL